MDLWEEVRKPEDLNINLQIQISLQHGQTGETKQL